MDAGGPPAWKGFVGVVMGSRHPADAYVSLKRKLGLNDGIDSAQEKYCPWYESPLYSQFSPFVKEIENFLPGLSLSKYELRIFK